MSRPASPRILQESEPVEPEPSRPGSPGDDASIVEFPLRSRKDVLAGTHAFLMHHLYKLFGCAFVAVLADAIVFAIVGGLHWLTATIRVVAGLCALACAFPLWASMDKSVLCMLLGRARVVYFIGAGMLHVAHWHMFAGELPPIAHQFVRSATKPSAPVLAHGLRWPRIRNRFDELPRSVRRGSDSDCASL